MEGEEKDLTQLDDAALSAELTAEEGETDQGKQAPVEAAEASEVVAEESGEEKEEKEDKPEELEEDKKNRIIKQQEEFIQRRNAEIGELRKMLEQREEELSRFNTQEVNDRYFEDPAAAVNEVLAQRAKEAEAQRLAFTIQAKQNEVTVKEFVPDFDELLDDMVEVAKELKYPQEVIQNFRSNPYAENPAILVNMANFARVSKENKALKAEIETLRKKPEEALKKVEAAARAAVTGATGKAGGSPIAGKQVVQMSDAELAELLNSPED